MKSYNLVVCAHHEQAERQLDFAANDPASIFDWVDRNAPGHDFELFEDGRMLGRVCFGIDEDR